MLETPLVGFRRFTSIDSTPPLSNRSYTQQVHVYVLALTDDMLAEPRHEPQLVLPVTGSHVRHWIDQGLTRKLDHPNGVLLVQTRNDKYPTLIDSVSVRDSPDIFKAAGAAETVVFMCHHCNTHSPAHAKAYLAWLRQKHPKSRQRVKVLYQGIGGIFIKLQYGFTDFGFSSREEAFKRYAVPGTEKCFFP